MRPMDGARVRREWEAGRTQRADRTAGDSRVSIPVCGRNAVVVAWLPWVYRAAEALIHGDPSAVALRERPRCEVLAILRCAVELLQENEGLHARRSW
jgi:hypothetical protein